MKLRVSLVLWLTAVVLAGAAQAATVLRLEPGALAERSELIFIATVEQQRSRLQPDPKQVFTETLFGVDEVLKGKLPAGNPAAGASASFWLTQLGGRVENYGTAVPGYARFAVGERVLLFLERADTGQLVVTGLAQGKYTLTTDAKSGTVIAQRDLDGLHQVGRAATRVFANVPGNPNRMTLSALLNLVNGTRPPRFAPPKVLRHQTPQLSLPEATP